jgi:hypothetical protein
MTSGKRQNIYMTEPLRERAEAIIQERGLNGLTDLVKTLIREEYERRRQPMVARDAPSTTPAPPPAGPVHYDRILRTVQRRKRK